MSNKTRFEKKNEKVGRKKYLKGLVAGFLGAAAILKLTDIPKVTHAVEPTITGTGTAGEIAYFDDTTSIASSSSLLWDESGKVFTAGDLEWDDTNKILTTTNLKWEDANTKRNFIGGYSGNNVTTDVEGATISGGGKTGEVNKVTDNFGTIGGGKGNQAGDDANLVSDKPYATVGGGSDNTASGDRSTVGGGYSNDASASYSIIGGGESNTGSGSRSAVGGGSNNTASNSYSTIGGGSNNTAGGSSSTVGGGSSNTASGVQSTVSGGTSNEANNDESTVGGGYDNTASGIKSTVGGGFQNIASAQYTTVSGGYIDVASGYRATVCGGGNNTASGNSSTVGGGYTNTAAGDYSFAAGRRANVDADDDGTFLFADSNALDFNSEAPNEFAVRCTGGARFVTAIDGSGTPTRTVAISSDGEVTASGNTSNPTVKGENTGSGTGVHGVTANGVGVLAEKTGYGWALSVKGKSKFGGWVIPTMDNKYKLGYGSKRWKAVHAADGVITTSLSQFKENIEQPSDIEYLESVPEPIYFNWKDGDDKEKRLGFMGDHLPRIARDDDGGIYTSSVTAILCGAMKQMNQTVKQLREDNDATVKELKEDYETKIERLEKRIEQLETRS